MSGPTDGRDRKALRRWVATLVQIAITAGVLLYLLHDADKRREFAGVLRHANLHWLTIGTITYGLVELCAARRWEILLHVQGIILSRWRLLGLLLIGLFFNFFIPGGTGGDVVKVFYLVKETRGRGPAAVLSVLMDRIVGLFSLVLLSAAFIATRWAWLTQTDETRSCVLSALVILGISAGFVIFASFLSGFGLAHRLPHGFPARERLSELALALNQYGRARRSLLSALLISVVCHLAYIFMFYSAGRSLAEPGRLLPSYLDLCSIMPVVNTITSLPISIGGLGVREGLFQIFLNQLSGIHGAVAMVVSSTGFLITAAWGAIGGLLYLAYRPTERIRVTHITEEVAALEHQLAEEEIALELAEEAKPCANEPEKVR